MISKQRVEGAIGFLLTTYSKKQEERNELKKELLSKSEPELKRLVILSSYSYYKTKNVLRRTLRVWPNNRLIWRLDGCEP